MHHRTLPHFDRRRRCRIAHPRGAHPHLLLAGCALLALACTSGTGDPVRAESYGALGTALPDSSPPAAFAAAAALDSGRPWRATLLVAPLLADSTRRTPPLVYLAARAAAAWGGWREVRSLLASEPWLDARFGGAGRELLGRAALELGDERGAVTQAERAVRAARTDSARGARLVLLARAYDRLDSASAARDAYAAAAPLLPAAGDWLRLRAARLTSDERARGALLATVSDAAARGRARFAEADGRLVAGDTAGAARLLDSLASPATALRLRLAAAASVPERDSLRTALHALATRSSAAPASVRTAVALLDSAFPGRTAAQELELARAAFRAGLPSRAARGFARAFAAGSGSSADRFSYAEALERVGRLSDAAAQYERVQGERAGVAAYRAARSLLRSGRSTEARSRLRRVVSRYPRDPAAAGTALYLLADMATDEGRDSAARDAYRTVVARYPGNAFAPRAAFNAAIIALMAGDARLAASELDALAARWPGASDATAALYWAGRAFARAGNDAAARARWSDVREREPMSYYALLASRRLGEPVPLPTRDTAPLPGVPTVDSAIARASLLAALGLADEATREYAEAASAPGEAPRALLAAAEALSAADQPGRAIALAAHARTRGARATARLYRVLYPVAYEEALTSTARTAGLDRALVAALIRQESNFVSHATSRAGARGLMQIMPSVGATLARGKRYPVWDPALLWQPDVSLELGTTHLATLLASEPTLERVLAAYNAGASRVARWAEKRGAQDPEVFVERIPFDETRDYVRIILRSRSLYRGLYGW